MTRGRKPNWNPIESCPSTEDLMFQSPAWYARYPRNSANHLSPEAYKSYFTDKTLTWEIGNAISGAAKILLQYDSD